MLRELDLDLHKLRLYKWYMPQDDRRSGHPVGRWHGGVGWAL